MVVFDQSELDGVRLLRLAGSLTQDGVDAVEERFTAATDKSARAVVDLSAVDLITTPGLTLLLTAFSRLQKSGGRLVLTGAKGLVQDLLRRCRLDQVLTIVPNRDEAVQAAKS